MKLLFIVSFLWSECVFGQTLTIENKRTGELVKGVFIYSKRNQAGVISDSKGIVDLSSFENDEVLFFQHLQFLTYTVTKIQAVKKGIYLTEKDTHLPPVYFDHPLRYNVDPDDEAGQIESIPRDVVRIENPPTSADMLQNTGSVLVQKSQGGGGSPIIRGFEANKLLLVIDGVRMNNAIYRSGHLQNSLTIDNAILDHTEIIFGPSSSLYGSDALGGVIHFHTRDPYISGIDTVCFTGSTYGRYNTNNKSVTGHFDFSIGKNKWGLLSSFSASKFGNIIMGKNRTLHGDSLWGLDPDIIVNAEPGDAMVSNLNPNLQVGTGYTQFDMMEKFVYQANDRLQFTFNFQYSTSSNIDRYDKLNEYNGGYLKYTEWHYGPQNRLLAQLKLDFSRRPNYDQNKKKMFNMGTLSLAYQSIDEDRISRRYQSVNRTYQEEDVEIISVNLDFNKVFGKSRAFFYGLEAQHNIVQSTAFSQDIFTGISVDAQTRYPLSSNYLSSGLYAEYKQKFKNKASFTAGLRYSIIYSDSKFDDSTFIHLPFSDINIFTSAPSGHIGLVFRPDSITRVRFSGTTGFRAPNIDDYGKIFEKKGITVIPNDNLKPEYAIGSEASIEHSFLKKFITLSGTIYGTYLFNAMVQHDFTLNGKDSILYEGDMTKIQAIVNTDHAVVFGGNVGLRFNFNEQLSFDYSYNYTRGIDLQTDVPLEHIPPQFGRITLTYGTDELNTAFYVFYNFRKRASEYAPAGDNIDLTPNEGGIPPWWTLNYRISYTFWGKVSVQASAENILDVHYRQFASGISQAGRNFMFSVRVDF